AFGQVGYQIKFPKIYNHEKQMEGLIVYMEALSVDDEEYLWTPPEEFMERALNKGISSLTIKISENGTAEVGPPKPFSLPPPGPNWSVGVMIEIERKNIEQEFSVAKTLYPNAFPRGVNKRRREDKCENESERDEHASEESSKRRKDARISSESTANPFSVETILGTRRSEVPNPFSVEMLLAPRKHARDDEESETQVQELGGNGNGRKRSKKNPICE
ncbi:hypothetical protein HDU67_000974, partial [Dinochytrium kinnereticum]